MTFFTVEQQIGRSASSTDLLACGMGQWGTLGNGTYSSAQGDPTRIRAVSGLMECTFSYIFRSRGILILMLQTAIRPILCNHRTLCIVGIGSANGTRSADSRHSRTGGQRRRRSRLACLGERSRVSARKRTPQQSGVAHGSGCQRSKVRNLRLREGHRRVYWRSPQPSDVKQTTSIRCARHGRQYCTRAQGYFGRAMCEGRLWREYNLLEGLRQTIIIRGGPAFSVLVPIAVARLDVALFLFRTGV